MEAELAQHLSRKCILELILLLLSQGVIIDASLFSSTQPTFKVRADYITYQVAAWPLSCLFLIKLDENLITN